MAGGGLQHISARDLCREIMGLLRLITVSHLIVLNKYCDENDPMIAKENIAKLQVQGIRSRTRVRSWWGLCEDGGAFLRSAFHVSI